MGRDHTGVDIRAPRAGQGGAVRALTLRGVSDGDGDGLTYLEVGATKGPLPLGYRRLERQRLIGRGRGLFERAATELMAWGVQRGAGLAVDADTATAQAGAVVRARLRVGTLGVTAPCRVVYTVTEPKRVGFAYGTLPGHPESGEELFLVEHLPDDSVRLAVRAFSRPARWYSRLARPLTHVIQAVVTERYLRALDHLLAAPTLARVSNVLTPDAFCQAVEESLQERRPGLDVSVGLENDYVVVRLAAPEGRPTTWRWPVNQPAYDAALGRPWSQEQAEYLALLAEEENRVYLYRSSPARQPLAGIPRPISKRRWWRRGQRHPPFWTR